jgi:hypothetical protein
MIHYKPNWTDPRVISRAHKCIAFVEKYVRTNKPQWLSCKWIYHPDHFGSDRNPISLYLKELLLICVNESYVVNRGNSVGKCKEYIASERGMTYLKSQLGLGESLTNTNNTQQHIVPWISDQYQQALSTGDFIYKKKSDRYYTGFQNVPRKIKKSILAQNGYIHDYDIECAAHTLLLQQAQSLGMDEYLFAYTEYIKDRKSIRERIARELELEPRVVKEILLALLQGALISTWSNSDIYTLCLGDISRIEWLKQDTWIQQYKADIKKIWAAITPTTYRPKILNKRGVITTKRLSSRIKSGIYRSLETQVMDPVMNYLTTRGIQKSFRDHDGFTCEEYIDTEILSEVVRSATGLCVRFEYECLTTNTYNK